jgi:hypothetical protein
MPSRYIVYSRGAKSIMSFQSGFFLHVDVHSQITLNCLQCSLAIFYRLVYLFIVILFRR